jgi:hypothetical protein
MILDKLLAFTPSAQAITVTAPSTDVIDLGVLQDLGIGDDPSLEILCLVTTAFTAAGAATMQVAIQGSVDNAAWTDMAMTNAIGKASLVAGAEIMRWSLPSLVAGQSMPRYLRLNFTVATGPMTAGAVLGYILLDRQQNVAYPPGITISN